ncbi:MAG: hypothetical protein GY806_22510 [Gammaproteobacteria bacterium]|nr:hypothetical protein [Gammaproteobacteria bacterium]
MSEVFVRPGLSLGNYPQKKEDRSIELEQKLKGYFAQLASSLSRRLYSKNYVVKQVSRHQQTLKDISEEDLTAMIDHIRSELHRCGLTRQLILKSFAIIREASARVLAKCHYDVQVYGGWLMINDMLAEMETGEGKTLTTTLASCTAALAGIPVHVITANDYLAARDCEIMQPLYDRLGLSSASIVDGMETDQRQQGYAADIVHTTNKQIAFDYLRDRIEINDDTGHLKFQYRQIQQLRSGAKNPLLLRGLCFAIVDEADSVLIDEAITPLIITKTIPNDESADTYGDALYLASILFVNQDFTIDKKLRRIELTHEGEEKLEDLVSNLPSQWQNSQIRQRLVTQALTATHFYTRDKDYLVKDDKVQIIDQSTGRVMADRSWEQGLHQMIEAKEGCAISELREPQARISYQRFFSRYLMLGGTSGTISEVGKELRQVYQLNVIKVAPNRRNKRVMMPERLYRNKEVRDRVFVGRIKELAKQHRAVLIGTCSVEESESISEILKQQQINHQVLNARQDEQESEIIAQAGQAGAITVATNMAGRGTDIALDDTVAENGGLHVIALSRNPSKRIDRQLYGRSARQGDPGSAEAILSLEDNALEEFYSSAMIRVMARLCLGDRAIPGLLAGVILWLPQQNNERRQRIIRKQLTKQDQRLRRTLAFSGKFE